MGAWSASFVSEATRHVEPISTQAHEATLVSKHVNQSRQNAQDDLVSRSKPRVVAVEPLV